MQKFKHFINKPVLFIGFIKKHRMLTEQEDFDELNSGDQLHNDYKHVLKLNKMPAVPNDQKIHNIIDNLKEYSGAGSKILNHYLLSKSKLNILAGKNTFNKSSEHHANSRSLAKKMDKHISTAIKMHKAEKDFHVYSGMSFTPEYKKGKIHLPAYTSTSLSKKVAQDFAKPVNHSLHIYDKNGKKFDFATFRRQKSIEHNILKRAENHDVISWNNLPIHKQKAHSRKSTELYDKYAKIKKQFNIKNNHPREYSHMIKLHIPEGSHALYLEPHTENSNEHEVVIHKNAQVHLHDKPEIDHENKYVMWQGKLIHDGIKPTKYMKEIK